MAGDWRKLARCVPGILLRAGGTEPRRLIWHAKDSLDMFADEVSYIRSGFAPADDFVGGVFPTVTLQDAHGEIDRSLALYAMAGRLTSLSFEHLGFEPGHWMRRRMEERQKTTRDHASGALDHIRAASSLATASRDAAVIASQHSEGTPLWRYWMAAVEVSLTDADIKASFALELVRRMRQDVLEQFQDACLLCLLIEAGAVP